MNVKKAIKTTFDKLVLTATPELLPFAPEGSEWDVNLYVKKNSNMRLKESEAESMLDKSMEVYKYRGNEVITTRIRLNPDNMEKIPEEEPFF